MAVLIPTAVVRPDGATDEWDDWIADWLLSLSGDDIAPSTLEVYERSVRQFMRFIIGTGGAAAPGDVRRQDVEAFMAHLTRSGMAKSTRRVRLMSLRSFFGWMVDEPETPLVANPALGIMAPVAELPRVEVVSDDTLAAILKICAAGTKAPYVDLRDAAIIRLLLSCGLRRAELVSLDLDDLDVRRGELRVTGKGRKLRWVSFGGSKLPLALSRYLRSRRKHSGTDDPALFLSTRATAGRGWRLTGGAVDMMLKRRCQAAGVPPIHPHQLRHTWAHATKEAGLSDEDLEVMAGWSSPMMVRRYGRAMADERARDAHRRLAVGDRL